MSVRALAALALAVGLAVPPAVAAEHDGATPREDDQRPVEVPLPSVQAPRVVQALDGLRRLRLHPGEDGLDVTETVRKHPEPGAE